MIALEIALLLGGVACIAASYFIGRTDKNTVNPDKVSKELSSQDIEDIKARIDSVIDSHINDAAERTEAKLDKISNTKILEMNDYAEAVINQINKNHNETVFLYDMLNEKAKEVKNTVKQVNNVNAQINAQKGVPEKFSDTKLQSPAFDYDKDKSDNKVTGRQAAQIMNGDSSMINENAGSKDMAKERFAEFVRQSGKKNKAEDALDTKNADNMTESDVTADKPIGRKEINKKEIDLSFDKSADKNDKIIALYLNGLSDKEIARELNIAVGEVKLVVNLYKNDN